MLTSKQKSACREFAFQFIYQYLSHGQWPKNTTDGHKAFENALYDFEATRASTENEGSLPLTELKVREFAREMAQGIWKNRLELETILSEYLPIGIEKTHKVDLGVLLIGSYELTKMPETPKNVVINEAVELAKRYGEARSGSLVNAVLDKLAKLKS